MSFIDLKYGSRSQRATAIRRKCQEDPRVLEFQDYYNLNYLDRAQLISFLAMGSGVLIPAWATKTKRKYRARNSKIWVVSLMAEAVCMGVHIHYSDKNRRFVNSLDKKYFAKNTLKQISHT